MEKSTLRPMLKDRRAALSREEHAEKSRVIAAFAQDVLARYQTILAYGSKGTEVETLSLIAELLGLGKTVAVPIIEKETRTLRLSRLESLADLEVSTFDVPEPVSHERPFAAAEVEVVLLPLLGFDGSGNRVGYGAGYYDRFLAANPHILKFGIAFACQEVSEVSVNEFDVRLDMVITEHGVRRFP